MDQGINLGTATIGIKGYFKLESFKCDWIQQTPGLYHAIERSGTRKTIAEFENQILNAGMNYMGDNSNWAGASSHCQVGTGGTEPVAGDTSLEFFVAGTSTIDSFSTGAQGAAPWYSWDQRTYRFPEGDAAGNISEAAVGWSAADGPYIITRAKVRDIFGAPTTATVQSDEWLDVTYQLRYYPPLGDVEGQIVIDGQTYNTITRASQVNTAIADMGDKLGLPGGSVHWYAYDGDIGELWEAPDGTNAHGDTYGQWTSTYQNNSYQNDVNISVPISGFNLTTGTPGIRSMWITTRCGRFQTQFNNASDDSRIPKTTSFTMLCAWRIKWAGWYMTGDYTKIADDNSTTPAAGEYNLNVAETLLRINWTDDPVDDQQSALQVLSGSVFRIVDQVDPTKWVEYTASTDYTEGGDYTYWTVSETAVQNSGPTVGNLTTIVIVNQQNP